MQSRAVLGIKVISTVAIGVVFSLASLAIGVTIDEVAKSAAEAKPLTVVSKAPNSVLKDTNGKAVLAHSNRSISEV
jgi:hypothetical protein